MKKKKIFSVKDYWIDEKNYTEAAKLCNVYTQKYFGFDDEINQRIKIVNENFAKNKSM